MRVPGRITTTLARIVYTVGCVFVTVVGMAAAEQQSQYPDWKAEALRRKLENERSRDVERRWEHLINTDGADAPEWMRETALKKKAARANLTANGIPPWMQEMQRRNDNLTKKMKEAQKLRRPAQTPTLPTQSDIGEIFLLLLPTYAILCGLCLRACLSLLSLYIGFWPLPSSAIFYGDFQNRPLTPHYILFLQLLLGLQFKPQNLDQILF
ncbi:expressed protein [Echinococcus multilocularis]|uniref:Expressed protein n=1 Tax=Echinococcus multilocularis TaxID=6211 RepID=A0A068XYP7_ECHMU|nr:expressed protein [Echinococcus multilocularis]